MSDPEGAEEQLLDTISVLTGIPRRHLDEILEGSAEPSDHHKMILERFGLTPSTPKTLSRPEPEGIEYVPGQLPPGYVMPPPAGPSQLGEGDLLLYQKLDGSRIWVEITQLYQGNPQIMEALVGNVWTWLPLKSPVRFARMSPQ